MVGNLFLKDKRPTLWPDMTCALSPSAQATELRYLHNNLPPTHGTALRTGASAGSLLLPMRCEIGQDVIQNITNTLALLWCMFAQVFPMFRDTNRFATIPITIDTVHGCSHKTCAW